MPKQERILVVDDEIVIRELLFDILTDEGFVVELACNGRQALDIILGSDDFLVLFTDIMMPEMDGIELIREARKVVPKIVPIVMTGFATLETARAAVKEGAYDYVLKPFNLSEVKLAVNNALERYRLQTENTRLEDLSKLFNISESIAAFHHEKELLDFVMNAALESVGAARGSLMLVSDDGKELRVASGVGLPLEAIDSPVSMEDSISGWVARHMRPLFMEDIEQDPEVQQMSRRLKDPSFVSVPLERKGWVEGEEILAGIQRQRVLAVLNVTEKQDGTPFTDSDLSAISIIANHAAAALENVRLLCDIEDAQREIVFTLGEIVETRSLETGFHVKRVSEYCRLLAEKLGLPPREVEILWLASPLHDVGKVGIPDAILNKPGKLTPEEFEVIKTHSQSGYDMLKRSKGEILQTAAILAFEHHERWDGGGYPQGLAGEGIHLFGRITAVADVFDALGAKRKYKEPWDNEEILKYFQEVRGTHFDPLLVDLVHANMGEMTRIKTEFKDEDEDEDEDEAEN
jgi:response regulator RpfG family c-di-GMP phosphodiesterase